MMNDIELAKSMLEDAYKIISKQAEIMELSGMKTGRTLLDCVSAHIEIAIKGIEVITTKQEEQ